MTSDESRNSNRWLLHCSADRFSQNGEDGIVEKVLDVIGSPVGWCVEFGAWDGVHLSNTWHLIENKKFSAVLVEGSSKRFRDLERNTQDKPNVVPINAFVGFDAEDGLDSILSGTDIPEDFDVLSIDIDGNDYHVWKAVSRYKPRVVLIEYNPTIPSAVEFVQPADMTVNQGSSILSLTKLAQEKNYELVCATDWNCIFVRSEYYDRFDISDNSVHTMRPDESMVTWIFCGMDGTVFLSGYGRLPWHGGIRYRVEKMQQVSRLFRKFPSNYGPFMRFLSRQYRSLKKRRLL